MKKFGLLLLLSLGFISCSEYQKTLSGEDVTRKYEVAEKMYNAEKYNKAVRLFEQIAPGFRGKPESENMYFMYADASYKMEQYAMAAHLFERFITNYPRSQRAEQAWLLMGKSYAELSPKYSKDQVDTYKAIEKLQEFINLYPDSQYAPEANSIITQMQQKIEKKFFEIAKQYNTIAGYTRDYNAAIVALDNFLIDYPGSIYTEDALFYKFDSLYKLGMNSVDAKKKERLEKATAAYQSLLKYKAATKYKEEADKMVAKINEELQKS